MRAEAQPLQKEWLEALDPKLRDAIASATKK